MGSKCRFLPKKYFSKTEGFMTSQRNSNTNTIPEPNWMKEDCVQSIPKKSYSFYKNSSLKAAPFRKRTAAVSDGRWHRKATKHPSVFPTQKISSHPHGDPQICHTGGTAENESDRPPDGKENARKEGVKLPPSGRFQETFRC